jgi:hypothetical protein
MQLGGALGVALIGIIFYGSINHPQGSAARTLGHGFVSSSYLLIAVAAAVLVGIQLLPRRAPGSSPVGAAIPTVDGSDDDHH